MADLITGGWLHISNGTDNIKQKFQVAFWKVLRQPVIKHLEGKTNLRYDLQKEWLEIKVKNIEMATYSEYETFVASLLSWQDSGDLTVGIIRNSSNEYIEMKGDGNGTTFSMTMPVGLGDMEKRSKGDQQVYRMKILRLSE